MSDTWQKACARIFEEYAVERPRLAFFGVDLARPDESDSVRYLVHGVGGGMGFIDEQPLPTAIPGVSWLPPWNGRLPHAVAIGSPRSGKESTMREWNREGVP